jgi:hypothetical protein
MSACRAHRTIHPLFALSIFSGLDAFCLCEVENLRHRFVDVCSVDLVVGTAIGQNNAKQWVQDVLLLEKHRTTRTAFMAPQAKAISSPAGTSGVLLAKTEAAKNASVEQVSRC